MTITSTGSTYLRLSSRAAQLGGLLVHGERSVSIDSTAVAALQHAREIGQHIGVVGTLRVQQHFQTCSVESK
jgi:hypothetical protein